MLVEQIQMRPPSVENGPPWRVLRENEFTTPDHVLAAFGVTPATVPVPLPIDWMIKALGISLYKISGFKENVPWSGATRVRPGKEPEIWLNTDHHENHMRFSAAHELAHVMLHVPTEPARAEVLYRNLNHRSRVEIQANDWAARLLAPDWTIVRERERYGNDTQQIARAFGLSEQAMAIRRTNAGV